MGTRSGLVLGSMGQGLPGHSQSGAWLFCDYPGWLEEAVAVIHSKDLKGSQ